MCVDDAIRHLIQKSVGLSMQGHAVLVLLEWASDEIVRLGERHLACDNLLVAVVVALFGRCTFASVPDVRQTHVDCTLHL